MQTVWWKSWSRWHLVAVAHSPAVCGRIQRVALPGQIPENIDVCCRHVGRVVFGRDRCHRLVEHIPRLNKLSRRKRHGSGIVTYIAF